MLKNKLRNQPLRRSLPFSRGSIRTYIPPSLFLPTREQTTAESQYNSIKTTLRNLQLENAELQRNIKLLNDAMHLKKERLELYKLFDAELNSFSDRIQERFNKIQVLSEVPLPYKRIHCSNAPVPDPAAQIAKYVAENPKKKFGNPTIIYSQAQAEINQEINDEFLKGYPNEKSQLIKTYDRLVIQALANERIILINKMKLRLNHDHRDLNHLRRILNKLQGGGEDLKEEEQITTELEEKIKNLKKAIEFEQEQMKVLNLPKANYQSYAAAVSIQSLWRGYKCRLENPLPEFKYHKGGEEEDEFEEEEDQKNE